MEQELDEMNDSQRASEDAFDVESAGDLEIEIEVGGEEDIEGEEGEDGIDHEEEDEYIFRFKNGVNPLDFVGDGVSGIQMYQRFERLEYEVLAEKKRKALAESDCSEGPAKKARQEDIYAASMDDIMEAINYSCRKRSRKLKKRGRRRGSKKKLSPELSQMLGGATLHYVHGRYKEATSVLSEVIRLAPNLPDPYHTLGLVHDALGNRNIAFEFYMLAANFSPRDSSLWKLLFTWSMEQGNTRQTWYCLSKAITADPKDISLRYHQASLYIELENYQRAAESYEQIQRLSPSDFEAVKIGAKLYQKCGRTEQSISVLEEYLRSNPSEADLSVIDLLVTILMETRAHDRALQHIDHVRMVYYLGKELPLKLQIKAGICHLYLKDLEKAEVYFSALQPDTAHDHADLITEVADSFMSLEHFNHALKYYQMLETNAGEVDDSLHLKIAQCYLFLKERVQAIMFFYKALDKVAENVDARVTLASLLVEDAKEHEAISLLCPPENSDPDNMVPVDKSTPWWLNEKIKLKLYCIYRDKDMLEDFVTIFPLVREALYTETLRQKVKARKKLTKSVLTQRSKRFDDQQTDNVFPGYRPILHPLERLKAARARKLLQKRAAQKEEMKAAAVAAGLDWQTDDSDDEPPREPLKESPLPSLLKEDEHHSFIIDLCKALASLRRCGEALEIIKLALKLSHKSFPAEKKEELRSLGAQMAYNTVDPKHGLDCIKYIVQQHPYSFTAWNCYYKVTSRLGKNHSQHSKFLRSMRVKHKGCVPSIVISGHQFTMISHHQDAAREYLEAYKLLPNDPLVNLCVGTSLINLALGFRLQNKRQCLVQGLAFLYNNLQLCENNQEALYNIARAFQHVGLVSLAASYYEKVLAIRVRDYPIPKLPNENLDTTENQKPGYCDLRREAAFNLHLIYKQSGAIHLARQVLIDHCNI